MSKDANDACDLRSKKCAACTGNTPRLTLDQVTEVNAKVPKWQSKAESDPWPYPAYIVREIRFKNFAEAVGFINLVAVISEEENHHPDIELHKYNRLTFRLTTHSIRGLSENDFILAAKIDGLAEALGL